MQRKIQVVIVAVVVVVAVLGGYALLHRSKNMSMTSSSTATSAAVNNALLQTKSSGSLGQYLADPSGKPLYTYNSDTSGVSKCTGTCLASWPAYLQTTSMNSLSTNVSTLTRSDNGQTQYTYKGKPLYYFVSDTGATPTGNGVANFELARP
ncbi:MAG TPA: hypothetical protein VJP80_06010 [Candidatus Saccharimonadales bacterium]|nr:hypothetical protein [Candidatus Saccharimonadales bacterium]